MNQEIQDHTVAKVDKAVLETEVPVLDDVTQRHQTWDVLARKWNVDNPVPPWKSSLDGICDALDESACAPDPVSPITFLERRNEEDALAQERYAQLPYPENQLVALAHSLIVRGVTDSDELAERMAAVRRRLES